MSTPYKRVRKHPSGKQTVTWIAVINVNNRRVKQKSFRRKSDAQHWYDKEIVKYRTNPDLTKQQNFTFEDLIVQFTEKHLDVIHDVTSDKYKILLRIHIEPFFRYMKLLDINTQVLFDFRRELSAKIENNKISPKYANDILFLVRLMLGKAVHRYKQLPTSPYDCDPFRVPKKSFQWWDDKDYIKQFLNAARVHRYYPAFVCAFETGMREQEICGLCKEDIDFKRGQIHVYRQWLAKKHRYAPCKHDIERWIDFDPDSSFGQILGKAVDSNPETEILFPTIGLQHIANSKLSDAFSKILKTTDLPRLTLHGCRHTFASWYMEELDDVYGLMRILGHANITTTHKYMHNSSRRKRQSLNLTGTVRSSVTSNSLPRSRFSVLND